MLKLTPVPHPVYQQLCSPREEQAVYGTAGGVIQNSLCVCSFNHKDYTQMNLHNRGVLVSQFCYDEL